MLVGIVTSTYSTVFIASAIAIMLSTARARRRRAATPTAKQPRVGRGASPPRARLVQGAVTELGVGAAHSRTRLR